MSEFWLFLSNLGDSRWLLPMAMVLLLALPRSEARFKRRWALAIAATAGLTLASKLAFMGWGLGIQRLDFTGISGHAAMSSAIYPMVGVLLATAFRNRAHIGAAAGVGLAVAIAASRLPLHAHSLAEVMAGLALGLASSAWVLRCGLPTERIPTWAMGAAVMAGLALPLAVPELHTHRLVIALAKLLSGRTTVFEHF
ncbi:TPA: phosphatase PAP2 family protein [Stenotrophomonas maltophilia]